MDEYVIYAAGFTQAMSHCIQKLKQEGFTIVSEPNPQVTHLLLPVPSFTPDGMITGGGNLATLLTLLPKDIVVIGGNLDRPELDYYTTIDLLQDEAYLAENAHITAHCAIKLAMNQLPVILDDCPVLVLGWGRIGKCLAQLLRQMGAKVTVCARKEADRSILRALGYGVTDYRQVNLNGYRVIFNTVPTMLFPVCPGNGLKIDLASRLGLGSEDVIWARGLPGKMAPAAAGKQMARRILYYIKE